MMEEKTHWKKLMDKTYIGDWNFEGRTTDLVLTVSKVVQEEVYEPTSNTKSKEVIMYFKEIPEKLVCNTTNAKRIEAICGTGFVEDWVGHRIALYFDKTVKFGGKQVGGVRVRPNAPSAPKCMLCGKEITANSGMTAEGVAEYTTKKYGRQLCADCAMKEAEMLRKGGEDDDK